MAVGKDHSPLDKTLLDKFGMTDSTPAVIFRLQVTDPAAAKTGFDNLWNQLMEVVTSLAPPEIADMVQGSVKFNSEA